jgi:outer membrane protein assembly factor BamB
VFAAESLVHALDGGTGQERWRFTPVTNASIGKSAVDDRAFYFGTGTTARRIYALNRADGGVLWNTEIGPEWEFRGWVRGTAVSGDTVYATAEQYRAQNGYRSSGWLIALDRFTGRIFWRYTLGAGEDARNLTSSPVIVGRLILASDYKGNAVIAVDRFTGQLVWETAGEAGYAGPADSPVVVGDTAYVGSGDTHVYALDVASGKILWRARTEASVNTVAVCGRAVIAQLQSIVALDRATGRRLGALFEGADEFIISDMAAESNRVFMLGNKGIYGLSCPE